MCQFCFELNTFVVVKLNVCTYEETRLLIGADFRTGNTFGFEDREEIFSRSVVIWVPMNSMPLFCCPRKIYTCQTSTSIKNLIAYVCDTVGDAYACKFSTITESINSNTCNTVWNTYTSIYGKQKFLFL